MQQKAPIIFVYVCPSVSPHVSAQVPLGGFSWNLILGTSMKAANKLKICWNLISVTLHEDQSTFHCYRRQKFEWNY